MIPLLDFHKVTAMVLPDDELTSREDRLLDRVASIAHHGAQTTSARPGGLWQPRRRLSGTGGIVHRIAAIALVGNAIGFPARERFHSWSGVEL